MKYIPILILLASLTTCMMREVGDSSYKPTFNAKAAGIVVAVEKATTSKDAWKKNPLEITYIPPFEGRYAVAVIPSMGFKPSDLENSGLPKEIVVKMEEVLYRFGTAMPNTVLFYKEGAKYVSYSRVGGDVPDLLTVVKDQGGPLKLTLKGAEGVHKLVEMK